MAGPIGRIKFSQKSIKAMQRIRESEKRHKLAATIFAFGTFQSLVSSSTIETTINISSQDWTLFAQALSTFPVLMKHEIRTIAGVMMNDYSISAAEREFWWAVLSETR